MKIRTIFGTWLLLAGVALAQNSTSYNFNVGMAIPDGNVTGFAVSTNLGGLGNSLVDVSVSLDISGGYNGDLYAYLVAPNGGFAVLLNRPGVTTGNSFGYQDSGFNITLDDAAANNIHFYQSFSPAFSGGQLTGTWAADGENVDPLGNQVGAAGATATLASLAGINPNGNWTFFIADLSSGGTSTLNSFGLTIVTVPEPGANWLMGLGLVAGAVLICRRPRLSSKSQSTGSAR